MKLKKYHKKNLGTYFSREIIFLVLGIFVAILIINHYYKKFNDLVIDVGEIKAKNYISRIVNEATKNIEIADSIFIIDKNNNDEIKTVTYDIDKATEITNIITDNIQKKIDDFEDGSEVIFEVPMGIIYKNSLFRNMGPNIKIKLDMLGDVLTELNTEVKPYGINNALVELRVKIVASVRLVLPLGGEIIRIENTTPIAVNIVNGKVPDGYIGTYNLS